MKVLLIALLALVEAPAIAIVVSPRVMMAGSTLRLTCRVTPHPDNRKLRAGFTNWTETERDLKGAEAPITHQFMWNRVPCEPGEGFCTLVRTTEVKRSALNIEVTNCN